MTKDKNDTHTQKIIITGGAGLVGQNLVLYLRQQGYTDITVLDKHKKNLKILQEMNPGIITQQADLAESGPWTKHFEHSDIIIMLQAQISALQKETFIRNTLTTTQHVITAAKSHGTPFIIHISSSAVNSAIRDHYAQTKTQQEDMVINSGIEHVILRPSLMFGWFDRKHLGWLSRFMKRCPVFPVPGHGKYIRQPLYIQDFCAITEQCIKTKNTSKNNTITNISGLNKITYMDIIRSIKQKTGARCIIIKIPRTLFYNLLKIWAAFDKSPPFTADQLTALTAGEEYETVNWPEIFQITATDFETALHETLHHPVYSKIILEPDA